MSFPDGHDGSLRRASVRNPRRRQRPESDTPPQQPRRKRSKITTDTHKTTTTTTTTTTTVETTAAVTAAAKSSSNGTLGKSGINGHAHAHAHAHAGHARRKSSAPPETLDVVLRTKKGTAKRPTKSDGSSVLTQNEHYSVRQLPSTPDILRNSASDFRGSILQSPPLALAVTRERAYIWDYTAATPVSHPRTFDVSPPARPTEPLPIGALVPNRSTKTVGLVVIASTTGRCTYWENIDTAESLSLFQQRSTGVEGSLGSLFGGETVVDMTSAEHAGFIVTLSSGRIAQVTLADTQGKPRIAAYFLRSNEAASTKGLFGGIKSALGVGAWKRDVVAVHTRPLGARREMQTIAATETGQVQVWDLAWSGQSTFKGSFDFRDLLQIELAKLGRSGARHADVRLLDMAIAPAAPARGDELLLASTDFPDLLLLAQTGDASSPDYALVQVGMSGEKARLERIIAIRTAPAACTDQRPRLLLPKPGHTAHIVFEQQVIIASLTAPAVENGPEAQLLGGSYDTPDLFQDAIHLRGDRHLAIEGCCEEDLSDARGASTCAAFIKGFGLARITVNDASDYPRSKPTITSKIEQAIFYGSSPDNIFDFSRKPGDSYDQEDVENAALHVSQSILCSTSSFIPAPTVSMENHLSSRVKAVRALINYLRHNYSPLTPLTSWKLMADAEKLTAAHAIWTLYDAQMADSSTNGMPKPILMSGLARGMMSKKNELADVHEVDAVRHIFVNDVWRLEAWRHWILMMIVNGSAKGKADAGFMQKISEADDAMFSLYNTVFAFRQDNADVYGLDSTLLSEGVLEEGYEDLPEPWTSTYDVFNAFNQFIDVARDYTVDFYEQSEAMQQSGTIYVEKVAKENVKLVNILCLCYRERIGYVTVHYGDRGPAYPPSLAESFTKSRSHHLRALSKIGQSGAGIGIAEKYRDMETLVKLVINESAYLVEILNEPFVQEPEKEAIRGRMDDLQRSVDKYFRIFGDEWSNAFFDSHLASHRSYGLLKEAELYQEPLTRYLRAEKARGRLSWINEVLREEDYEAAAKALTGLARENENKIWNKKVELSLGKLASLAVKEEKQELANGATALLQSQQEDDLTVVNVQEAIKAHIQHSLFAAVDLEAEVHLASDAYAINIKRKLPALNSLLEIALEDMLKFQVLSVEQVIDVLTLMQSKPSEDVDADIAGTEFYLALLALKAGRSTIDAQRFDTALRLICKRCYLADEWDLMNKTARKSDKLIASQLRETMLCKTMVLGLKNCKRAPDSPCGVVTNDSAALFEAGSDIRLLPPGDTLGAGCSIQELQNRFPTEDIRDPVMHDNKVQDRELQQLIDKCRLQHWHDVCQEEAKKVVEEEVQAKAADEREAKDAQDKLSEKLSALPVKVANDKSVDEDGLTADEQSEAEEFEADADGGVNGDGDEDGDGDVEMS
ncbi:hypothetical protein MBLNU459_g7763t3 [Dothideomycetes sp. NU459]